MKILHIISDPLTLDHAVDKRLAYYFLESLSGHSKKINVDEILLYEDQPPFFNDSTYRYLWLPMEEPEYQPSSQDEVAVEYLLRHCRRVNEADVLMLSAPIWNFYVPAILKAWIDQIISPNQTYRFGADGIQPLHRLQRVMLMISSGGEMSKGRARDNLIQILSAPFHYIGVKQVDVVWAEGQDASLYPDHERRFKRACRAAEQIAQELLGQAD